MSFPFFSLQPGHDLPYNEIVRPTRRWAFSYYFLHRWLPRLHPQQAMLIQVLRQATWQQGRPTGRCQLANATLCRLMGWAESSHKTLLAELDRPLSDWFVARERTRKRHVSEGHAVEGAPRYRILMDEPLTPQDQAALMALLATRRPASPYEAAELLAGLAGQRTRDLWVQLDEQDAPATLPNHPATVAEVACRAWPHLPREALAASRPFQESAERCQLRLTGAGYAHMELDYLLHGWLPTLGINQSWLLIVLRARCFFDAASGELRDIVTVSRRELEQQLGLPERTFRRLLRDEASLPLFHIAPAGAPANPANPRHLPTRGNLSFHIAYPLLPIAPNDRDSYEALLLGGANAAFSTSGQPTRLNPANQPASLPELFHERPANPAGSGQPTRLVAANQPGWQRPTNPAGSPPSGQPTRLNPASEPTILLTTKGNQLNSYEPYDPQYPWGGGETESSRATIRRLLEPYAIQGVGQILQNPALTVSEVRGWILRGTREVAAEKMGGYLFRRLAPGSEVAAADPLPASYRWAGEIASDEAALFEQWWVAELSPPPFADGTQRSRYGAWLRVVKRELGDPDRPDYSPHACWRREMARSDPVTLSEAPR